tara:strand:- start:490 stop:2376 length:1887 start_codon:yes stop_codon:yes gene_type:complete
MKHPIIDKILTEWSYRVHDGMPNPKNPKHLVHLRESLEYLKLDNEVIDLMMNKLYELEFRNQDAFDAYNKKHKMRKSTKVTIGDKETTVGAAEKSKKDKDVDTSKSKGDYESKQNHIDKGFVKGAAPGNAGSMYNEIMSGEVADMLRDNPDKTEEELVEMVLEKYGDSNLAKQNSSNKMAGGLKTGELPEGLPKEKRELYSKTLIAVRSGKRKHQRSVEAKQDLGWKNTETSEYFGDKTGLLKQEEDIKSASKVMDLDGNEIPKDEVVKLIRAGGGGDNPSDTATIIKNKDTGEATILFTSDKDSTNAIIAQSSTKAESTQTDEAILSLGDSGKISPEESEAVAGERRNYASKLETIESRLKNVTEAPAKHVKENFDDEALDSMVNSSAGANSRKYFDVEKNKFSSDKVIPGTDTKYSDFLPEGSETPPTDKQVAQGFLNYSTSGIKDLTSNQQKMIQKANTRIGGPDINDEVEKVRKDSIEALDEQITELDQMDVDGVGLGTYIEGNNIWKQGHMGAISGQKGVHKHRGMFETNHAGTVLDGNVMKKALGVESKEDFLKKLKIEKTEFQKSKDDKVTGSTGLVYMMIGDKKVPIMEKRQRTKDGPLGKLQTVYKWTPEFQKLIRDNQ